MKKLAIILSIFPGMLFVIALVSYVICSYVERDLPPGSANIGLGVLFLAALINIPTMVAWCIYLAKKRGGGEETPDNGDTGRNRRSGSVYAYILTAVVIGILSIVAISTYMRTHNTPDMNRVSSIEEWEKRSRLPSFTLLDRADLPGYYVCVYDTGLGEIAFCYYQKRPESANSHSFAVFDTHGQNLQDPARWNKTSDLNKPGDTYLIAGVVVPVKPDYRGGIDIEFKADSSSGLQLVYKKRLAYERKSDQVSPGQPANRPAVLPESGEKPQPEAG